MRAPTPHQRASRTTRVRLAFLLATPLALLASGCLGDVSSPAPEASTREDIGPAGWLRVGTPTVAEFTAPFAFGVDRAEARSGSQAAFIASRTRIDESVFGSLMQSVTAVPYRGLRVRWSAWLRPTEVLGSASAWIRVDGPTRVQAFDNMGSRALRGTSDWVPVSVVVDVPDSARSLSVGVLLAGMGDLLVDDARLEIVDTSVPVTDLYANLPPEERPPAPVSTIPAESVPINLDFEGAVTSTGADQAIRWLRTATVPFRTAEPGGDDSDLAPLGAMLGTARLVGLGESTHGTREFFQLKHRVFEYLVRHKGFTHFAIEGSWAEANEIDHYVRTGEGDARRALSKLGFWTWNTEEVLALIEWMRAYNTTAGPAAQVRFLGFDMQFASLPADTIEAFAARAMPAQSDSIAAWLACLAPFRRIGDVAPRSLVEYEALPEAERTTCRANLGRIAQTLDAYTGSEPTANVRQSARVLLQWERVAAAPSSRRTIERDLAMAENVAWLREQAPSGTGVMLWAHNGHVVMRDPWMGHHLRARYGDDYRAVALLFGTGSFTAQALPLGTGLRTFSATILPNASLESALRLAGGSHLMFDARQLTRPGTSEGQPYRGPLTMRAIGSGFNPQAEISMFGVHALPEHFDHVLFVREATASRTLPFVP